VIIATERYLVVAALAPGDAVAEELDPRAKEGVQTGEPIPSEALLDPTLAG
jgi:hypothetical protein